jgi:hypothetical protein
VGWSRRHRENKFFAPTRTRTPIPRSSSKAIPVTGQGVLQGCEMSRIPHRLDNRLRDGEVVSFMHRPRFNHYWYSFLLEGE